MAAPAPLLVEGETVWRTLPAARMGLVIDGAPFFQAFRALAEGARRSITALGWDFDTRLDISDREAGRPTLRLARFLDDLVGTKEDLVIHLLSWSPSILYVLERDPLLAVRMGWLTHDRLHFELDDTAPVGACHHMKLSVFDGRSALCGGIDLTHHRWDSPAHLPDDPRRVTPLGVHYGPYHDVDLLVQGPLAAALEDVARQRWEHATGRPLDLPAHEETRDDEPLPAWPLPSPPELENVVAGVVRTLPAGFPGGPVRETERFLTAAIASAEHTIYLENQYLTAPLLVEALGRRLEEPRGPEVVAVLPHQPSGWLENETMGTLTAGSLAELMRHDLHGHLRIKAPQHEGKDIFVHSKVLVVDDRAVYIGSANATVRSLMLDTECGIAIDAGESPQTRAGVRRMLTKLAAHHLDLSERELALRLEAGARLKDFVDTPGNHRLIDLSPTWRAEDPAVDVEMLRAVADPQDPVTLQGLLDASARAADTRRALTATLDPERASRWRRRAGRLALVVVALLAAAGLLALALAGDRWSALHVTSELATLRSTPGIAVAVTVGVFVLAGALAFPLNPLIVAAGAAFGPALGMLVSALGALVSAALSYGLGALGRHALRGVLRKYDRTVDRVRREGVLAVAALRLLPVAPFPIVNTAAGAVRIRFSDFMIGSAIGLTPGVVLLSLFGDRVRQAAADPSPAVIALALAILAMAVLLLIVARRLARRHMGSTLGQPSTAP